MSFRWPLVAAALGFLLTLIARLPLQWIIGQLPAGIACDQPLGTLWRGSCAALRLPWINLGTARWHLHAGSLLRGRLQAQVDTNRSVLQFSGIVSLGLGGEIRLVDADLRYTLGSALFASPVGSRPVISHNSTTVRRSVVIESSSALPLNRTVPSRVRFEISVGRSRFRAVCA